MKREAHLFEKVIDFGNLRKAGYRAARGKKLSESASDFLVHLESEVLILQAELQAGTYQPEPYKLFTIYERKPRLICAAPFRDRVVHHALCHAIEPNLERYAIYDSYACRVGKGTHRAVKRLQDFSRKRKYCLRLDIHKFFSSVDQEILLSMLSRRFKDKRLLSLIKKIVFHTPQSFGLGKGLPIGNLTSQHFANFYLGRLDHFVRAECATKHYIRYMDDLVLLGDDKEQLWSDYQRIEGFLQEILSLQLNTKCTKLISVVDGVAFLGFQIWPNVIRLQPYLLRQFRRRFLSRYKAYQEGQISLEKLIRSSHSMIGHISHADTFHLRRSFFSKGRFDELS